MYNKLLFVSNKNSEKKTKKMLNESPYLCRDERKYSKLKAKETRMGFICTKGKKLQLNDVIIKMSKAIE